MSDYQDRGGRNSSLIYWVIAIMLLVTGVAAPIGFLMIVLKLLGGNRRSARRGRHPYYAQQEGQGPVGARTSAPRQEQGDAPKRKNEAWSGKFPPQDQLTQLSDKGKKLMTVGGIVAAIFGFCSVMTISSNLWILPDVAWFLEETLPMVCFFFGGFGARSSGVRVLSECRNRSFS